MTVEQLQELQRRVKRAISYAEDAEKYARSAESHKDTQEAGKARRAASDALSELQRARKILMALSAD